MTSDCSNCVCLKHSCVTTHGGYDKIRIFTSNLNTIVSSLRGCYDAVGQPALNEYVPRTLKGGLATAALTLVVQLSLYIVRSVRLDDRLSEVEGLTADERK